MRTTATSDDPAITLAKQLGVALVALTAAWVLASALAPAPAVDGQGARSLLTMPYVAAAAAIVGLLSFNSFGFSESQLFTLGPRAAMVAISAGAIWFALGVLTTDNFSLGTVLHFFFGAVLLAALVGAVVMIGQLLARKLAPEVASQTTLDQ